MDPETQTPEIEGATLTIDSSIADPLPTVTEQVPPKQQPGAFMTPDKLMGVLKQMVEAETITPQQARQMRAQFGIHQSYFTGKKVSHEQKKAKKAIADASKKKNRANGSTKGVKRNGGRGD